MNVFVTPAIETILTTAGPFSLFGILLLVILLIQREIATSTRDKTRKNDGQAANMAIVPLLVVFIITVIVKVLEIIFR